MTSASPAAIGVDIGGTRLRAAAVSADGTVVARESSARPEDGPSQDAFIESLLEALADVTGRLGADLPVGIAIASLVDRDGRLVAATNLDVGGVELRRRAVERLGAPHVSVVNDATAACLAEARVGGAVGHDDVLLVTVGTGVGGGALVAGRLLRGSDGLATEFGHIVVAEGGRRCPCGTHGCLEAYAAGRSVGEIAGERLAEGRTSGALASEPVIDGEAVTRAARAGDEMAVEVIREAGRWLGIGLASLTNVLDPAIVLVGGGAGQAMGEWLLPAARAAYGPRVLGHARRNLAAIEPAALGDDAGVVGAALLAIDECHA